MQITTHNLIKQKKLRVCLDSRLIKKGDCFIAVKGENFNGHDYIEKALKAGAIGWIDENQLYELVQSRLLKAKPKIIGVTGSAGKSTTVNFIYTILKSEYGEKVAIGGLNTKLGLAVNFVNNVKEDCKYFVAEMAMDYMGELIETTKLFKPDIAVITTINNSHLEKLVKIENITKAKFQIASNMHKNNKLFVNIANEQIKKYLQNNDVKPEIIKYNLANANLNNYKINILGEHNKSNLLASILVCKELGISEQTIKQTVSKLKLPKGRLTKLKGLNNSTLIDDTYNANPESTIYALQTLNNLASKNSQTRKIAILGNMLELGDYTDKGHKLVAKKLNELNFDILITVGEYGKIIYDNCNIKQKVHMNNSNEFESQLIKPKNNDFILIKGSQGARMEKITEKLLDKSLDPSKVLPRQDKRWKS